jgi:UDP-N-acetylglucosamine:LPS N-acetylglucosamine transferase|tara:strand:- start:331 stop:1635 length:1305 start_codon:yes stop_codon:yes gene_type:complete
MVDLRILVPTHVIPSKKNKLINYVENIATEVNKKVEIEVFWFIFQPDTLKTENNNFLDIHNFNNAIELLQKIKPDCIFANNNSREPISYSLSIAAKYLKIPLVYYYLNDLSPINGNQPDIGFTKNMSILLRNFFSDKVVTDTQGNASKMRRGKFFIYKNMFLFKTRIVIGTNYAKAIKLLINDLILYVSYKKPIWNKLSDLNLCSNTEYYDFLIKIGIEKNKINITGNPFWDKIFEKVKVRKNNKKQNKNNIKILVLTGSLVEHGFWKAEQRDTYLEKIFSELQREKNISFDLKIHPASEDIIFYEKFMKKQNCKSKIYQQENIWDIIDNYDLVLSYGFSTSHTECAYGGIKMILLDVDWNFKRFALVNEGISSGFIIECKKFEEIQKCILDLLSTEIVFNEELLKAREKLAYKFDGNAGERAATAIIELIKNY